MEFSFPYGPIYGSASYDFYQTSIATLRNGTVGTRVVFNEPEFLGSVYFDRFGLVAEYNIAKYASETYGEVYFKQADGTSVFIQSADTGPTFLGRTDTTSTFYATDGSITTTRQYSTFDAPYDEENPGLITETTITGQRHETGSRVGENAFLRSEITFYDNGEKTLEQINKTNGSTRILEYTSSGAIEREQRFDETGKLIYETIGQVDGSHSSMQVRADGIHTALYEGNSFVFKDLVKNDGTVESYSRAAGQTHGGMTGNDTFNGYVGGEDTFVFGADFGNDTVRNFEAGSDIIRLLDPSISPDELSLSYGSYGRDTIITVEDEGTITLKGVHIASLADLHITSTNTDFGLLV